MLNITAIFHLSSEGIESISLRNSWGNSQLSIEYKKIDLEDDSQ